MAKATPVNADGSTRIVDDVPEGALSITLRDEAAPKIVTPAILREVFRFRSVEEILRGPRPSLWAPTPEIVYVRDVNAPGIVFRHPKAPQAEKVR